MSDRDTEPTAGTDRPTGDDDALRAEESRSANAGTDTDIDTDPTASDGDGEAASGGRFGSGRPITYLTWIGVAVLAVTALVALFGFYTGVSRAISVWVSSSYRPLVNAAFNLALLLAALGGIGLLLRRTD